MREPTTQKPRYSLTISELERLSHFNLAKDSDWSIYKEGNVLDDIKRNVKIYLPNGTLLTKENLKETLETRSVSADALKNHNQALINPTGLDSLLNSKKDNPVPNALIVKLKLSEIPPHETHEKSELTTLRIRLKLPPKNPDDFIFIPGTVIYHREYIKETDKKKAHYKLTSISFSNAVLRDLYLDKIALSKELLEKKIDEALQEESEEAKYDYYKSVALSIQDFYTHENNFDQEQLANYRLKHLKKILAFLMQTHIPVDGEFKESLIKLTKKIPDLKDQLDKDTYEKLNLFLDPQKKLIFWPLENYLTTSSQELTSSENSVIKAWRDNNWKAPQETQTLKTKESKAGSLFYELVRARNTGIFKLNGKKLSQLIDDNFLKSAIEDIQKNEILKKAALKYDALKKIFTNQANNIDLDNFNASEKETLIRFVAATISAIPASGNTPDTKYVTPWTANWQNALISKAFGTENYTDSIIEKHANCTGDIIFNKIFFIQGQYMTQTVNSGSEEYQTNIHPFNGNAYSISETNSFYVQYADENNEPKKISLPGQIRIIHDIKTGELVSIETSNPYLQEIITNKNETLDHAYLQNLHKKATVEDFKQKYENLEKNLQTSFKKNMADHRDDFFESFNARYLDDHTAELKNFISNHLRFLEKIFVEGAQFKQGSEKLFSDFKHQHDEFIKKLETKLKNAGIGSKINEVENFFEVAFIKATQAYTNQSILNIAKNGFEHIKENMNSTELEKAYQNITLAQTLKDNADKFYSQKKNDVFTKDKTSEFFVKNMIRPILKKEPALDIQRNKWDLPLKNIGMFFITFGTWGLFTVGKAIYAGLTNLKYKYYDNIDKRVSYTLDSHTQSYKAAREELLETRRLNKLVSQFGLKK